MLLIVSCGILKELQVKGCITVLPIVRYFDADWAGDPCLGNNLYALIPIVAPPRPINGAVQWNQHRIDEQREKKEKKEDFRSIESQHTT